MRSIASGLGILMVASQFFACGGAAGDDVAGSGGASGGAPGASGGAVSSGGSAAGTGGSSSGGSGTASGGTGTGSGGVDSGSLVWRKASLTNYESYPDPGSEECIEYNGCEWSGDFAAVDGTQTEQWVSEHNIVAAFATPEGELDFETYKLHTLRLRQDGDEIDVVVYDTCGDSDCSGCCTQNAQVDGNLIDIEKYTMARFNGRGEGTVEWACLDCN